MKATRNVFRTAFAGFLVLGIFSGCVKSTPVTYALSSGTKPEKEVSKPESEDRKPELLRHLAIDSISTAEVVRDTPKNRRIIRCDGEDKNRHPHPKSIVVYNAFYEKAAFEIELEYGHVGSVSVARVNSRDLNDGQDFFLYYRVGTSQNPTNPQQKYLSLLEFSTDPAFQLTAQTQIKIKFGPDGKPTNLSATDPLYSQYEVSTTNRSERLLLTCEAESPLEDADIPENPFFILFSK